METGVAPGGAAGRSARLAAIDWLRGLAVVLMIEWHLYDSWTSAAGKATEAFWWVRFLGGIPSRLFLLLVGVSMAIKFESQIAKHVDHATMVRGSVKRGLQILLLAYLFRLQEYALGGFGGNWVDLFRVDILNCIGASMVVAALIAAPRGGRPQVGRALVAAAVFLALGPIIGPANFPRFLPRAVTAYIGGPRPAAGGLAGFPLFPWAAWSLVGVALGHYWVRQSHEKKRQALAFVLTGVVGAAMTGTVILIRRYDPHIIHYPNDVVQQMGPGTFFYRLGLMGPLVLLAYLVTLATPRNWFSPMQQLGRTSLLVYWIHVDLCYGLVSARLHHKLSIGWATVGFVLMNALMLLISVLKTKYWRGLRRPRGDARSVGATSRAA